MSVGSGVLVDVAVEVAVGVWVASGVTVAVGVLDGVIVGRSVAMTRNGALVGGGKGFSDDCLLVTSSNTYTIMPTVSSRNNAVMMSITVDARIYTTELLTDQIERQPDAARSQIQP